MVLLTINHLETFFRHKNDITKAVNGLDLTVNTGEIVGLVGESGSGKTMTALSILRLVPEPGQIMNGEIYFKNQNILTLNRKEMQEIRGKKIGLVMQDPLSALNPVIRVGEQVAEVLRFHFQFSRKKAKTEALETLTIVQLDNAEKFYDKYPHQLSGGQRQRILIAIALACRPQLLIADEPTTALDVTIQSQILDLLKSLKDQLNLSLLLITHDLGVVAQMADRVAVMYAGKIVEEAPTEDLFCQPLHPYTHMLLDAVPKVFFQPKNKIHKSEIKREQKALQAGTSCDFSPRCPFVQEQCTLAVPEKVSSDGRLVRCIL